MIENVRPPEIIVFLRTSSDVLLDRIKKRGRDYE